MGVHMGLTLSRATVLTRCVPWRASGKMRSTWSELHATSCTSHGQLRSASSPEMRGKYILSVDCTKVFLFVLFLFYLFIF